METIFPYLGVALCTVALLQLVFWSTQTLTQWSHNKKQFEISREALRRQIEEARARHTETSVARGGWYGFRDFQVHRLVKETELTTSVYLKPVDGKPIAEFRAGQHLTFKFDIRGASKPVVRCYSLSDGPGYDYYRISVKQMMPPRDKPDAPAGRVSTFVNQSLGVGDRLQVKAPSGHFFLDETSSVPIVMLAGGIGITPMISMIDRIVQTNSTRKVVLFYGSRNGSDHAFKKYLDNTVRRRPNIQVINVYSEPLEQEQQGVDFHESGFISFGLLKRVLPNNHCQFYLCGPPPFMEDMYNGLIQWQVPDSRISYEAFGPASIGKKKKNKTEPADTAPTASVTFAKSQKTLDWDANCESLLEFAEQNDIVIDSGCRAGSCGSCETALIKGKVCYGQEPSVDCEPGSCLVCIAKPVGAVELEA